jgi:hypothetical protein
MSGVDVSIGSREVPRQCGVTADRRAVYLEAMMLSDNGLCSISP